MEITVTTALRALACRTIFGLAAALVFGAAASAAQPSARQQSFASPDDAATALITAAKAADAKGLLSILGPESKSLLQSGDAVADRAGRERFVQGYEEGHKLEKVGDAKTVLQVGKDGWPFPIPIIKEGAGWRFDTAAGKEEILNRRIGRNELFTIQAIRAYVDAQQEYYLRNPPKSKLLQYAQKFVSAAGKRDGLYYPVREGEPQSPLGPLYVKATSEGYGKGAAGKPTPFHGYYYRILKAQGAAAAGGAYDYVTHGAMIGGFALVAYPASYGASGIMSFIVNHDGVVYQKDFGADTSAIARQMTTFNPDDTWKRLD